MSDLADVRIPDKLGVLHNWRCWYILERGDEIRLGSSTQAFVWEPRVRAEAHCKTCHDIPGDNCGCGLYAAAKPRGCMNYIVGDGKGVYTPLKWQATDIVMGLLAQWGKVEEGKLATRSEFAYPAGVLMHSGHDDLAMRLVDTYGLKVMTTDLVDKFYTIRDHPELAVSGQIEVEFKETVKDDPDSIVTKWVSQTTE